MIKLVITDMDGTLLNDKKEVPVEIYDLILKLKERGVTFVAASGRQYFNLIDSFEPIKEEIYYIAENGAYILKGSEELSISELPKPLIEKLLDVADKIPEVYPILCGKGKAYVTSDEERVITQVRKYYTRYEVIDDLHKVDSEIFKIAFLDFINSEKNVYPHYQAYTDQLQISVSAQEWMDIMVKGVNKGEAVKKLQQLLGVKKSETMIFGDFLNDYEMMQEGEYSYAMANAHPMLKEVCNYECPSNNDNGVVETIKKVFEL